MSLVSPALVRAQEADDPASVPAAGAAAVPAATAAAEQPSTLFALPKQSGPRFWAPFVTVPRDLVRFPSLDTLKVIGVGVAGAASAYRWDDSTLACAQANWKPSAFRPGNIGGNFFVQTGTAVGLYSLARIAGSDRLSSAGADLVRAQVLTQALIQAGKFSTQRARPDGSDDHSLPSGHTGSAFATATVLQRHYGWRVGAPAFAFAGYVGAARMAANKHHLSDVLMGAAVGIAAGRTVTVGVRPARFAMGVAPTAGGAAVTFTKN